jgi:hypothetical protein
MASFSPELLKKIVLDQAEVIGVPTDYHQREAEDKLRSLLANQEVTVITGVRRCGKSVLMQRMRNETAESDYFLNFEDDRLATFSQEDFQLLYEVLLELFGEQTTFYFDEIQNIPGWEVFVRRLYNSGNKVVVTGSNATLFSDELGTRLTGRYVQLSIYPFSFHEYAKYKNLALVEKSEFSTKQASQMKQIFNEYCKQGGIPEYIRNQQVDYLHGLYESIIFRDIVVRYKLPSIAILKQLVFFLASNCSKETTYVALQKLLGLGSSTTIADYCAYLENSYLCFFVNRYALSVKKQLRSAKKVYFVDHALAKTLGFSFSEDYGRMLENIVYIELRRRYRDIYYHQEKKECDFVIHEGNKIKQAIQVCQTLSDPLTRERELAGLLEALQTYDLAEGYILTEQESGEEHIQLVDKTVRIRIMPVWRWLVNN